MIWLALYTVFLCALVLEAFREAFLTSWGRHYSRMTPRPRSERDFWTARRTRGERLVHARRWHIDLLARPRIRRRKR